MKYYQEHQTQEFFKNKKERGISKDKLIAEKGMNDSTIVNCINQITKVNLIIKRDNLYYRNVNFTFPKIIITGYEAKLTNYNKAFLKAMINKEYVDYSYMVFPMNIAKKLLEKYQKILIKHGIGLIVVSKDKQKTPIKAKSSNRIKK